MSRASRRRGVLTVGAATLLTLGLLVESLSATDAVGVTAGKISGGVTITAPGIPLSGETPAQLPAWANGICTDGTAVSFNFATDPTTAGIVTDQNGPSYAGTIQIAASGTSNCENAVGTAFGASNRVSVSAFGGPSPTGQRLQSCTTTTGIYGVFGPKFYAQFPVSCTITPFMGLGGGNVSIVFCAYGTLTATPPQGVAAPVTNVTLSGKFRGIIPNSFDRCALPTDN